MFIFTIMTIHVCIFITYNTNRRYDYVIFQPFCNFGIMIPKLNLDVDFMNINLKIPGQASYKL